MEASEIQLAYHVHCTVIVGDSEVISVAEPNHRDTITQYTMCMKMCAAEGGC